MLKKITFLVTIFYMLTPVDLFSQKKMIHEFYLNNIQHIIVNGDNSFNIKLNTVKGDKAIITQKTEGELGDNIILISKISQDTLFISSDYKAFVVNYNDKLSAHKTVSIQLEISLPINKQVYLKSNNANVFCQGQYKSLTVELNNGQVFSENLIGNITINTVYGNINVRSKYNNWINQSKPHKNINSQILKTEFYKQSLNTVNGKINIIKTE